MLTCAAGQETCRAKGRCSAGCLRKLRRTKMRTLVMILSVAAMLVLVVVAPAWAQGMVGRPAPEISAPYWLNTPPLTEVLPMRWTDLGPN